MPKYYEFKVAGYYLYFTSFCVVECMHVHASDKKLTEAGSAKFFVKGNGQRSSKQGDSDRSGNQQNSGIHQRKLRKDVRKMGAVQ